MFRYYETTPLEQFVEKTYTVHGIHTPLQLTIEEVSRRLNVWVYYSELGSKALERTDGLGSININKNQSRIKQWLDFLHELCHLLRHSGDQRIMPKQFTQAQEDEANNFVLYATMPISMISKLSLPDNQTNAIRFLATAFRVPLNLAQQRLEQIQRRIYQGKLLHETAKLMEHRSPIDSVENATISEPQFYAYFDPSDDYTTPSQIVIEVDEVTMLSREELVFSLDGPFQQIDENQLESFINSKPIKFNDMDYTKDGQIRLKLSHLASRYYNSAFKFIVQRKDIEQLLQFYGEDF